MPKPGVGTCLVCWRKSLRPAGTEEARDRVGSETRVGLDPVALPGPWEEFWINSVYALADMPMTQHSCLSPWAFMIF